MAPDFHTIDDLPISNNNRYAEDQASLEKAPRIREDIHIVGPAQADVLASSYVSAVRAFVGQDQTNVPIATFEPPTIYGEKRTNLFKDEVIPRLGNNEKLQLVKERLETLPEAGYGG